MLERYAQKSDAPTRVRFCQFASLRQSARPQRARPTGNASPTALPSSASALRTGKEGTACITRSSRSTRTPSPSDLPGTLKSSSTRSPNPRCDKPRLVMPGSSTQRWPPFVHLQAESRTRLSQIGVHPISIFTIIAFLRTPRLAPNSPAVIAISIHAAIAIGEERSTSFTLSDVEIRLRSVGNFG
jgi:hypothetical protein